MENIINIDSKKYVKAFLKNAFADFKKHWKVLLLAMVVMYAISFLGEFLVAKTHGSTLAIVIYQLIVTFMSFGFLRIMLNTIDGKSISVKQLFTGVTPKQFLVALVASLISGVFIFLGFLLLIVPGVIIAIALSMATYAIIDRNKGIWSSIKYSWCITKNRRFKMFVLGLVAMIILLLGFVALGVGLLVAVPIVSLMQARLYRELASMDDDCLCENGVCEMHEDKKKEANTEDDGCEECDSDSETCEIEIEESEEETSTEE